MRIAAVFSCRKGHVDATRLLLDNGADARQAGFGNRMNAAVRRLREGPGRRGVLLLDKGAEVDRATKNGSTPLCFNVAAWLLLDKGAEIDRRIDGAPLSACQNGHVDVAPLDKGAEATA